MEIPNPNQRILRQNLACHNILCCLMLDFSRLQSISRDLVSPTKCHPFPSYYQTNWIPMSVKMSSVISSLTIFVSFLVCCSHSCTFTITNNCPYTIWPATLAGSGTPQLSTTGFRLDSGQTLGIPTIPGWSGRIWARTGCTFDVSGVGSCQTGDCGGKLECNGIGAAPPASLFEITLGTGINKDFYDVSIVDGYNLPLLAAPQGVNGACNATGCASDINMGCPKELQVVGGDGEGGGGVVGCKSACEAFGLEQYCCSGEFANPTTCRPSFYSTIFKRACPRAYSYAFDDGTSTFTCKARDYAIVFCPNSNGVRVPESPYAAQAINHQGNNVQAVQMASSSNILLPFPIWVLVLISLSYHSKITSFTFLRL